MAVPIDDSPEQAALMDELRRLGWEHGRNLRLERRGARGDLRQLRSLAQELVAMQPDVLVGLTSPAAQALRETGTDRPIVFGLVSDPIGARFVKSLARPGGNMTGASNYGVDLAEKQLDLLLELSPAAKRITLIGESAQHNPVVAHMRDAWQAPVPSHWRLWPRAT